MTKKVPEAILNESDKRLFIENYLKKLYPLREKSLYDSLVQIISNEQTKKNLIKALSYINFSQISDEKYYKRKKNSIEEEKLINKQISDEEYYERRKKYFWEEIKKSENEFLDNNEKFETLVYILSQLDRLIIIGLKQNDIRALVPAYYKLIEISHYIEKIAQIKSKRKKLHHPAYSIFEDEVDQSLKFTDYQNEVVIRHPKMIKAFTDAINFSFDDFPCLIVGETGTGKELIARCVHFFSKRKDNNFITVNCGGFSESLFDVEIQGHAKGAYTGADTSRLGVFLTACGRTQEKETFGYFIEKGKIKFRTLKNALINAPTIEELNELGGTVFLDEINSLDISQQATLLRIIQEGEVRLAGEYIANRFYGKVICATNAEPLMLIKEGKFREDLYFRIAKGIVHVPPLRELEDSFEEIAQSFIIKICKDLKIDKKIEFKTKAIKKLKEYKWPGNLRELENVLYRALKRMQISNDNILKPSHIEDLINREAKKDDNAKRDYSDIKYKDLKKEYLKYICKKTNGKASHAEKFTGMDRITIGRKWIKYGIDPTQYQPK